ncbi:hypothetical protein RJZ56_000126 [Blastomyces dermatitidis]
MTPVMVVRIGWRAYPFFSAWNAILIPFIWFFYPETAGRSLEEINHIFAKGYVEKMNYVKVAKALPKLTDEGVDRKAKEYRLLGTISDMKMLSKEAFQVGQVVMS